MRSRFLFALPLQLLLALLICCFQTAQALATPAHNSQQINASAFPSANLTHNVSSARKAERLYFVEAQKALDKKQLWRYEQILPKLKNYPLLPYLQYQALSDQLLALPQREVEQFFLRYPNSYLSERLRHRWLRTLAIKELWPEYRKAYDTRLSDPELACLNIRARLATGDYTAINDIAPLWDTGKVQPKACDAVFDEWKQAGMLTPKLLWSRHSKAVQADEMGLATSLAQDMVSAQQIFALQYQDVAQTPRLILQSNYFDTRASEARASIALGLERYAKTDPIGAAELWASYKKRGAFTEDETAQISYSLARQLLLQDNSEKAEQLVAGAPTLSHPDLLEGLIREALRKQDWGKSYRWILRLPPETQKNERWRYWQARIMEQLDIKEIAGKNSKDIYTSIANTRSFYGFLASDKLGTHYNLVDKPLLLSKEFIKQVELSPNIQRAREFYLLGNIAASGREWAHAMKYMSAQEVVAAGRLADRWGWHRLAIETMGDAQLWDELQVRFPMAYPENVKNAARQTSVDEPFIFAITRQESAFRPDAQSPAGAMGLMQLLPSTAKATAKKSGLSFKEADLFQPEKNINLGSRYLDQLLGTFSGNRILVAAAYNAGPTRVKKWLTKDDREKLPYDVWIETIPYKETRNYVQNILAFSVIYGYRSGNKQVFVTEAEAAQGL